MQLDTHVYGTAASIMKVVKCDIDFPHVYISNTANKELLLKITTFTRIKFVYFLY